MSLHVRPRFSCCENSFALPSQRHNGNGPDRTKEKTGKVGKDLSLDEAKEEARTATINALSDLKACIGSLDKVKRCIKITGYVASDPNFVEQPKVLNAASDLLFEIFGNKGKHARSAVGVNVLPLNAPLEIDFIFEVFSDEASD